MSIGMKKTSREAIANVTVDGNEPILEQ